MKKTTLVKAALVGLLLLATPAAEARGFRGGFRGGGFRGGVIVAPAPWGYWGPYYDYGYPGFHGSFGFPIDSHRNSGEVKLDTKQKDAQVYIDGALAGTVKDMKSTWLRQGTYDLELRTPGGESYSTRIFVTPGKTLHVKPEFSADSHS